MTEELKQTIQEQTAGIPKEVRDAIGTVDWVSITEDIGKKFELSEDAISIFQTETFLVLVGLTDIDFYTVNIENQVGTIKDDAVKIAEEANQKIFIPISNILVENIKKNGKDKNAKWDQNLDFILSGGDYSSFVAPRETQTPSDSPLARGEGQNNAGIPMKPRRITDIKSKFTI